MGFRMRRSFKIVPGVRMTVSARGVSASVGGKVSRVTVNSHGRVTQTVKMPGTGVSYSTTSSTAPHTAPAPGRPGRMPNDAGTERTRSAPAIGAPKPGLFAPAWQKHLYKALADGHDTYFEQIARDHPEARPTCMMLDAVLTDHADDGATTQAQFEELWATGYDPAGDAFLTTYAPTATATVRLAPGVAATMPLCRDLIGLALAELRQRRKDVDGAITIVEALEPSVVAAVSLAELYIARGRWDDVVELTNGVVSSDDFSSFLLSQRGVAFREQGHFEAAREVFKAALARRSQPAELRDNTLAQRALTYQREGKLALARKDYERILADNPHYPGLTEALAALAERSV